MKEVIEHIRIWLNEVYPTRGDGCWSTEFIEEVLSGQHEGHMNESKVWQAADFVEPELRHQHWCI